jgi:hypothetical protein
MSRYLRMDSDDYWDALEDEQADNLKDKDGDGEEEICSACNGSGEGMYDGSRCSTCGGHGVL